jgi:hypothetical protein
VLWGLVLLVGGAARALFSTATPLSQLSSDEAHTGIQSLEALRGRLWVFVPGNAYGGNLEAWLDVPLTALLGPSALRLKLLFSVLWLVAAALVSLAVRSRGAVPGLVAFAAVWLPSAPLLLHSTLAYPGYAAGMVACGGCLLLAAGPLDRGGGTPWGFAGLGAAAGLAAWMHPFFLVTVVPPVLAVLWRCRREVRGLAPLALGGAVALALPVAANLRNGFASIDPAPAFTGVTYGERVKGIFGDLFARAVGARWNDNARACRDGPWTCDDFAGRAGNGLDDRWVLGPAGPVVTVLLLGLVVVAAVVVLRRGSPLGRACAAGLIVSPFGLALLGPSAYTRDARYASMLLPLAAVVLAQASEGLADQLRLPVAGAALVAWTVLAVAVPMAQRLPAPPVDPDADLAPLVAVLRDNDVKAVRAEYWIAYRLAYATEEEFSASPVTPVKFQRYERVVSQAEREGTAALVLQRYQPIPPAHPPRRVDAGPYVVFLP